MPDRRRLALWLTVQVAWPRMLISGPRDATDALPRVLRPQSGTATGDPTLYRARHMGRGTPGAPPQLFVWVGPPHQTVANASDHTVLGLLPRHRANRSSPR